MISPNKIYLSLPPLLQSASLSLYGFLNDKRRYGSEFKHIQNIVNQRDLYDKKKIKLYQKQMLSSLFKEAEKSHYWKMQFKKYDIDIHGNPFLEINKLPILTKDTVKKYSKEILIATNRLYKVHTSGSTGSGLKFWESRHSEALRWATWWRYRNTYGLQRKVWHGLFGGQTIISPEKNTPPYHRINYASKQVLFSCYHLSNNTVTEYIKAIEKYQLEWLHGYPSFIAEIASLALSLDIKLQYTPKIITIGAENLSHLQASVIVRFFGVMPVQHYGLAESVANFSQFSGDQYLTVDEDFSYVEFVSDKLEGKQKKIIGTNFTNPNFPLFRYDTGDLALNVNEDIFPRQVERVDGRAEDIITLPNGRKIGRLDHIFKDATFVDSAQLYQPNMKSLNVRIIKNSSWNSNSENILRQEFIARLGSTMKINFEYPPSLTKTKSGKLRFVESKENI